MNANQIIWILADASPFGNATNAQVGLWVIIAIGLAGGICAVMSVASYFATRREVEKIEQRVAKLEDNSTSIRESMQHMKDDLIHSGDRRSSVLHNRINPMVETLSALKASNEAFIVSFNNFTQIVSKERKDHR